MNRKPDSFLENLHSELRENSERISDEYFAETKLHRSKTKEYAEKSEAKQLKLCNQYKEQIKAYIKKQLGKDYQFLSEWMSKLAKYSGEIEEYKKTDPIDYLMTKFGLDDFPYFMRDLIKQGVTEGFPELETSEEKSRARRVCCILRGL